MVMTAVRHALLTKLLIVAVLLSVLWQLAASGLVERPRTLRSANLFYGIHEIVGLVTLALVMFFWTLTAVRRR